MTHVQINDFLHEDKDIDYSTLSSLTPLDYAKAVDIPLYQGTVGIS